MCGAPRAQWALQRPPLPPPPSQTHNTHAHSQVFNTLYLQLLGMSDFHSSLVAALFLLGTAAGAQARVRRLLGGKAAGWATGGATGGRNPPPCL